jgi:uncharacterized protein
MIFVLSPAKALDYDTPAPADLPHTKPLFVSQAAQLIDILAQKSPQQIAELMDLSDALSSLNVARYQAWRPRFTAHNSKQAVLAFNGDVYDGLSAKTLPVDALEWAQQHVRMLSGLYGVLRPLDWMQPYRLEMGTALPTPLGRNLYQFWGAQLAQHLQKKLNQQAKPVLVNLASQEYFKAVDLKHIKALVIECVFQEHKAGGYKVISFMAKRARGLMTRFAIEQRIESPQDLRAFNTDGYAFAKAESTPSRFVFRRKLD